MEARQSHTGCFQYVTQYVTVLIVSLLITIGESHADGKESELLQRSMASGGIEREYFVHLPSAYSKNARLPVVMALHGYSSTATGFASAYGLNAHADNNDYIIVYPQGSHFQGALGDDPTVEPYLITSWNYEADHFTPNEAGPHCTDDRLNYPCPPECGECSHCTYTSCNDDSAFLLRVLEAVTKEFNTDTSRHYLLGNSNGGGMAMRLGCDYPERFAAVGVSIYQMPPGHTCGPESGLPMLHLYGEKDDGVGHDGTATSYGWIYTSAAKNTRDWSRAMGCEGEPEKWRTTITEAHGLACQAYTRCPDGDSKVVSCMDPEAGHEWRGQRIAAVPSTCVTADQKESLPGQDLCPAVQRKEPSWGMDLFWRFFQHYERAP